MNEGNNKKEFMIDHFINLFNDKLTKQLITSNEYMMKKWSIYTQLKQDQWEDMSLEELQDIWDDLTEDSNKYDSTSPDYIVESYDMKYLKLYEDFNEINESKKKDPKLKKAGVEGYNKPKRTPNHPTKSHVVVAKEGDKTKLIRFGEQGAKTAGKPKKGESDKMKKKRKSFKARHAKNIKKGKMSAAYWADKVKW